jgi:hypothetical protein
MRISMRRHLIFISITLFGLWALWMLGLLREAPPLGSY